MTPASPQNGYGTSRAHPSSREDLEAVFSACRKWMDPSAWEKTMALYEEDPRPDGFPDILDRYSHELGLPPFLAELALLERTFYEVKREEEKLPDKVDRLSVNPSLQLLEVSWKDLPALLNLGDEQPSEPQPGEGFVLVWRHPENGHVHCRSASDEDLLVLKMVVEEIDPKEAAHAGGLPVGAIDSAIHRALYRGLLISPPSGIRRSEGFPAGVVTNQRFFSTSVFTLQWHVTQVCDLHCKHCYDRTDRSPLKLDDGLRILDDLREFCHKNHVRGQVSFSGGNPMLYPHFLELYQGASDRGLGIAILGNPTPREKMEELLAIEKPLFFQVSLEGLEKHNDLIRGHGNFRRVLRFLGVLRELDIPSMVMLTLTRDNMDQVLPLAEELRGRVDHFNFNRLALVGEGARLHLPEKDGYRAFLEAYMEAAETNPIMGLKDNLLNLLRYQKGMELFGGCAGYGCSAAFNFLAVLSDGQAHACRKFPSLIGDVLEQSIDEVYHSPMAQKYRAGSQACRSCDIRPVCGGCLAVVHSLSMDVFRERDPFCFREGPPSRVSSLL